MMVYLQFSLKKLLLAVKYSNATKSLWKVSMKEADVYEIFQQTGSSEPN